MKNFCKNLKEHAMKITNSKNLLIISNQSTRINPIYDRRIHIGYSKYKNR